MEGKQNSAKISSNSTSKSLSFTFTSLVNGSQVLIYIYHKVNLTQYLPDLVIAGFSASKATSGVAFTLHKIVSWDFTSTYLDDYETKTNPTSNYNLLLFVALGAGGGFVLVRLVLFGSSCGRAGKEEKILMNVLWQTWT